MTSGLDDGRVPLLLAPAAQTVPVPAGADIEARSPAEPGSGLATVVQAEPFHRSVRVCPPAVPAAHTLLAETAATPASDGTLPVAGVAAMRPLVAFVGC